MEALKHTTRILTLVFTTVVAYGAFAQEYDDLYFSASDRKKAKQDVVKSDDSKVTYESYTNNTYSDTYSAQEVNPEYIARYKSGDYKSEEELLEENENLGQPSYSNISYFPEDYEATNPELNKGGTTVINNYYGANMGNNWGNPYWGMNSGFGYDPWFGWNSGWNVSVGFGWGWGRSAWFYDPWYDPFWGPSWYAGGFYDPWGWNRWNYGWGGYGWNRWNRYNNAYNAGFIDGLYYSGAYGGYYFNDNSRISRRDVVRGGRYTRGGTVASNSRVQGRRNVSVVTNSRAVADTRDFSRTQNEYYNRSRSSVNTGASRSSASSAYNGSSRSVASGTSSRSQNAAYNSRSSASNDRSLRSSATGASTNARRYSTATSTSSSRSSYQGSRSSNNSRSYTPSSSSGSRSSGYSPSRSSGSRSSGYSPSRSSGGSSRSSYSPSSSGGSRSSGGSSGGRSSSGGGSRGRGGF